MFRNIIFTTFISFIVAVVLVLASCPLPITDQLVAALEDDFRPEVVFDSHADGDVFYSALTVEGHITDDAIAANDGRGQLRSLSMEVDKEGTQYTGGILLDSTGNVEINPDLGPLVINYPGDKTFSFDLVTSGFDEDINIIVTAVDLNGNSREETLELETSGGPRIDIAGPDDGDYFGESTQINLTGSLSNSAYDTGSTDEIASVRFLIRTGLDVEMTMDGSSSSYVMSIAKLDSVQFRVDGTTFSCSFYPTDSMNDDIELEVIATDRNNVSRSDSVALYYSTGGPTVDIVSPTKTGSYHSSDIAIPDDAYLLDFFVEGTSNPVSYVAYQISENGGPYGSDIPLYQVDGITTFPFPEERRFNTTYIDPDSYTGDIRIKVLARDTNGNLSDPSPTRTIYDDIQGPEFLSFSWENSGGSAVEYANATDSVFMKFLLNDALSGVNHSTLAISGTEADASFNTILAAQALTEGPYELEFDFSTLSMPDVENPLPFTLYAEDMIGNDNSLEGSDKVLKYYPAAPTVHGVVVSNQTDAGDTYLANSDVVRISLPTNRDLDFAAIDFDLDYGGTPADVDFSGAYFKDISISSSTPEGLLSWYWDYADMAGNTTTFSAISSGLTVDRTGPVLTSSSILGEVGRTSQVRNGDTITVAAVCSDALSGIDGTPTIEFKIDTGSGIETVAATTSGYTPGTGVFNATLVVDGSTDQGSVTAEISMTDNAGNPAVRTVGPAITIDSRAPVISIDEYYVGSDTSETNAGAGDTIEVEFTINESARSGQNPTVELQIGSSLFYPAAVEIDTERRVWTASYPVPATPAQTDNTVTLTITSEDGFGNEGTATDSSVSVDNVDPVSGTPQSTSTIRGSSADLSVVVTDNVGVAEVRINGVLVTSGTTTYTRTVTLPSSGADYDIDVEVLDTAGNADTSSATITLTDS